MARGWFVNGETLVLVKGRSDSGIASLSQLGLSPDKISVEPQYYHEDINVDAWGKAPAEVQWMLGTLNVRMTLVNVDMQVLSICAALSQGGAPAAIAAPQSFAAAGVMNRAGTTMGGNVARFAPGNNYIGLNLSSPIGNLPFRFFYAYLAQPPYSIPLGTEKSIITLNWRVIPYTQDPAGISNGVIYGATNYALWDTTLDS